MLTSICDNIHTEFKQFTTLKNRMYTAGVDSVPNATHDVLRAELWMPMSASDWHMTDVIRAAGWRFVTNADHARN